MCGTSMLCIDDYGVYIDCTHLYAHVNAMVSLYYSGSNVLHELWSWAKAVCWYDEPEGCSPMCGTSMLCIDDYGVDIDCTHLYAHANAMVSLY